MLPDGSSLLISYLWAPRPAPQITQWPLFFHHFNNGSSNKFLILLLCLFESGSYCVKPDLPTTQGRPTSVSLVLRLQACPTTSSHRSDVCKLFLSMLMNIPKIL